MIKGDSISLKEEELLHLDLVVQVHILICLSTIQGPCHRDNSFHHRVNQEILRATLQESPYFFLFLYFSVGLILDVNLRQKLQKIAKKHLEEK